MSDHSLRDAGRLPSPRPELIAATRNADKLALLARLALRRHAILPLPDRVAEVESEPEPESRPGGRLRVDPLVLIAQVKAISVSVALDGAKTIASDGGLLVLGLGDRWQPAMTRRFAGPDATNRDRAVALLDLADGLTGDQRRLGWREVVAIAEAGQVIGTFTAEATPGWLVEEFPANWEDAGQGFWVPRLWSSDPNDATPTPGAGNGHWDRLALLVPSFLDGVAVRGQR